jgi:hypothetical protein
MVQSIARRLSKERKRDIEKSEIEKNSVKKKKN